MNNPLLNISLVPIKGRLNDDFERMIFIHLTFLANFGSLARTFLLRALNAFTRLRGNPGHRRRMDLPVELSEELYPAPCASLRTSIPASSHE